MGGRALGGLSLLFSPPLSSSPFHFLTRPSLIVLCLLRLLRKIWQVKGWKGMGGGGGGGRGGGKEGIGFGGSYS